MKIRLSMYVIMLTPLHSNGMQQCQTNINSRILYQDYVAHLKNQYTLEKQETVRQQIKKNIAEINVAYMNEYDPQFMWHENEAEINTSSSLANKVPQKLRNFVVQAGQLITKKEYLAAMQLLNTCLTIKKEAKNTDGELSDTINQLITLATQKYNATFSEQTKATSTKSEKTLQLRSS